MRSGPGRARGGGGSRSRPRCLCWERASGGPGAGSARARRPPVAAAVTSPPFLRAPLRGESLHRNHRGAERHHRSLHLPRRGHTLTRLRTLLRRRSLQRRQAGELAHHRRPRRGVRRRPAGHDERSRRGDVHPVETGPAGGHDRRGRRHRHDGALRVGIPEHTEQTAPPGRRARALAHPGRRDRPPHRGSRKVGGRAADRRAVLPLRRQAHARARREDSGEGDRRGSREEPRRQLRPHPEPLPRNRGGAGGRRERQGSLHDVRIEPDRIREGRIEIPFTVRARRRGAFSFVAECSIPTLPRRPRAVAGAAERRGPPARTPAAGTLARERRCADRWRRTGQRGVRRGPVPPPEARSRSAPLSGKGAPLGPPVSDPIRSPKPPRPSSGRCPSAMEPGDDFGLGAAPPDASPAVRWPRGLRTRRPEPCALAAGSGWPL